MANPQPNPQEWLEDEAIERLLADPDVRQFLAMLANAVREAAARAKHPAGAPDAGSHAYGTDRADTVRVPGRRGATKE